MPEAPPEIDEAAATAALMQIAGQAIQLADKIPDERLKRIADLALKEVTNSGAVRDLLKIVTSQPVEDPNVAAGRRREDQRQQAQDQWAQSLDIRRQNQSKINELTQVVVSKLMEKLGDKNAE